MTLFYSPSQNGFLDDAIRHAYETAGTWPADAFEVTEQEFQAFTSTAPAGKTRGFVDGKLEWSDIPPATQEERLRATEEIRSSLLAYADDYTADMRTELMLGELSDDGKAALSDWMAYKRSVKAVSSSDAIIDGFEWPPQPS